MSNSDYDRPIEAACPHDGWYNGDPRLMIINGTFLDFRPRFVQRVESGKMKPESLAKLDEEWGAIPIDTRRSNRNNVIDDSTPKPKKSRDGKVIMAALPSDNGGKQAEKNPQFRKPLRPRMPIGALANRTDPFAAEEAAKNFSNLGVKNNSSGSIVPEFVDPSKIPALNLTPFQAMTGLAHVKA